ncbi:MAG: DNA-binding protein [Acidimicrobiales bacterium]|nr:MAG: DNA-binding protein [Acidimicrobiales bacterium]
MSLLGVSEAAEKLCVSDRRVRQMLADGLLDGERIGRAWMIDAGDLRRVSRSRPKVGRPWNAASAWAVLALAEGKASALPPVERSRAKERFALGLDKIVDRLAARADRRSFYVHPSVLAHLEESSKVVRGGVSAAADVGADILARGEFEGYVSGRHIAELVSAFGMDEQAARPNVVLRVVDDSVWPFGSGQKVASRSVVAVDLLESADPRSRRAGMNLLVVK